MADLLFSVLIYPIKLAIELIYMMFDWIFKGNAGISITGVSIAVSLGCLPLYAKAEALQQKERDIQKKMEKRVRSIKQNFRGDEQYMILSTYYRQNKYHPLFALRSSMSLLIQVPFFIAAYSFLSHLGSLSGKSLWIIQDLAKPDGLLTIARSADAPVAINVLPVLMTAINLLSGMIYTRGFPLKEKLQLYAMALLFLFLLYGSPAALVLYWTLNNIFSLAKNIVYKLKNPGRLLYVLLYAAILAFDFYVFFIRQHSRSRALRNYALTAAGSLLLAGIPFYIFLARKSARLFFRPLLEDAKGRFAVFALSVLSLYLVVGVYLPFSLAASSPAEFSFIGSYTSPFGLLLRPAVQAAGLLLFWPLYLYALFPRRIKALLTLGAGALLAGVIVNAFILSVPGGIVTQTLQFMDGEVYRTPEHYLLLNLLASALMLGAYCVLAGTGRLKLLSTALALFFAASIGMTFWSGVRISDGFKRYEAIKKTEAAAERALADSRASGASGGAAATSSSGTSGGVVTLSRTGRNVFVIMLDKAVNLYFPIVLEEKPELKAAYDGFTWYPNTLSYAKKTIIAAPPLFGGYEYTPTAMNERKDMKMVDKHNESLLVMPTFFKNNGFRTLVTDMPFVNYQWISDNAFFRNRGIDAKNVIGNYSGRYIQEEVPHMKGFSVQSLLERNFLFFSILTSVPVPLKTAVYNEGRYWNSSLLSLNTTTLDNYAALHYLSGITQFTETGDTFTILVNNLTHEHGLLEHPDYVWGPDIDKSKDVILGESKYYDYYHVNAAAVRLLAKWFDTLRKEGVYDNTRIIVVSDHGTSANFPGSSDFYENTVADHNPLLLVKDFGAKGPLRADEAFMTNADVPGLAVRGISEDDRNPYTGVPLSRSSKAEGAVIVEDLTIHQGYTPNLMTLTTCYDSGATALRVKDNPHKEENWERIVMP